MTASSDYALGYSDGEHQRLVRQAQRWRSSTERLFRDAGVGKGQRVLDLGSGIGDVTMLAAHVVGPSGEVVGIERDGRSVRRARVRAGEAGLSNVSFVQGDVATFAGSEPFDAVVGRFILQFVPDPAGVVRSATLLVRPGGSVVFQEVSWSLAMAANAHLPLWSACASVTRELIRQTGADTDVGLALRRIFLDAGLPEPHLQVEMKMSASRDIVLWVYDLLSSVAAGKPRGASLDALGDFATLAERLETEISETRSAVTSIAAVGGRSRLG